MADSLRIAQKLRAVAQMGRPELVSEGKPSSAHHASEAAGELMRPVLVYRIQENVFGLSGPRRNARIQDLASDANRRRFKTGTKIVREWRGQLHEVAVTAEGYLYKGDVYKSLSPIPFRITRTKWSGPAFFGTNPEQNTK
jgi:hypothetical protein